MHGAQLFIELGAVIIVLALAARVGDRLGISAIPLYLLIGLALGEGGLYPLGIAEGFIATGAQIGVVLLLLMLGLEYSADELVRGLRATAPVAGLDLVLNFGAGFLAGVILGWGPLAATVLGGVTYISSSGIIAKVVDDFGWLGNRETPMVLSLLVAEDLVMAAYLPFAAALLVGGAGFVVARSALVALVLAGTVLMAALRYGRHLSRIVYTRSPEAMLLGALGLTLFVAGVAERLNVSAAVGAFLVGIALSGPAQQHAQALLHPLRDLFAATFFVFFGLEVDPGLIGGVLPVVLALAAVTAATKVATAWWGARRAGIAQRGRRRAAALLVSRGEFSIVVANLGIGAGLDPALGPTAAVYVLLLAAAGPVAARLVHAPARSVRGEPAPAHTS